MTEFKNKVLPGHLGGSVGLASDIGSDHDLTVRGFEPRVGLSAVSREPTSDPLSPCLSASPPLTLSASQTLKNFFLIHKNKNRVILQILRNSMVGAESVLSLTHLQPPRSEDCAFLLVLCQGKLLN